MKMVSMKLPEAMIQLIDELVEMGTYPSRSALIRTAIRDLLKKEHPRFGGQPILAPKFEASYARRQGKKPKKVEEDIKYVDPEKYLKEDEQTIP